jgi:hypothetical protein
MLDDFIGEPPTIEVRAGAIEPGDYIESHDGCGHRVALWTEMPSGAVVLNIDVLDGGELERSYTWTGRPGELLRVRA